MSANAHLRTQPIVIDMDVGSTTVKAVALDPSTLEILWSDYQRHNKIGRAHV